ncbi:mannosyl-oligosaccharide alpha-1,2-mannosidase, partial [Marasmius crinis-equi]
TGWRDWNTGVGLLEGCVASYEETKTGLGPEIVSFGEGEHEEGKEKERDWYIEGHGEGRMPYEARYILRPETLESLFIAYRLTNDQKYRDQAWRIFLAIEKWCKVEGGYATVLDVDFSEVVGVRREDKQETFFLAETLKYLWLIFADGGVLPLNGASVTDI